MGGRRGTATSTSRRQRKGDDWKVTRSDQRAVLFEIPLPSARRLPAIPDRRMEPRWWHHASHHQIERRDIFWNKAPADGVSGWAGAAVLRPFGEQFNIRLPVNVVQVSFTKT